MDSIITDSCGVVVLNYNSHNQTVALVKRLASFSSIDYICVVDNNSKDDFDNEFAGMENIRYIKNTRNTGYSAGNNVGLRYLVNECGCEYVFIANPDVEFENSTINELLLAFKEDPRLVLVSTRRYGPEGKSIHQYFDFPTFLTSLKSCFFLTRKGTQNSIIRKQNCIIDNVEHILYVDAVPGAFFGLRGVFLIEIGFMYEGTFLYGEEIIIGQQARNLGYKSAVINTSQYIHAHVMAPFSNRKMFYFDRHSLVTYYKLFNLLNRLQLTILRIAIIIGTIEYNGAFFIHRFFKKILV